MAAPTDFTPLVRSSLVQVSAYRCSASRGEKPFVEHHTGFSVSYVCRGGFGYRHRGRLFEMTPGSVLVGQPGDDYECDHEHLHGDVCLSIGVSPELVDDLGEGPAVWQVGALPALPQLVVLGELASSSAGGTSDVALDEAAVLFVRGFAAVAGGDRPEAARIRPRDRRRMLETADWIRAHAHEAIDLDAVAAYAQLSPYHLLRLFRRTFDVTPHQYLVRCRIREAARLLAEDDRLVTEIALDVGFRDVSNFIRTFRRAAAMSPREFRRLARAGHRA